MLSRPSLLDIDNGDNVDDENGRFIMKLRAKNLVQDTC